MKRAAPERKFRLQGKTLYLTYPQCAADPISVMDNIKIGFVCLAWAIVGSEKHQDGEPHLHIVICLTKKIHITGSEVLDALTGKHGNYQTARNQLKVVKYTIKDGIYVTFQINVPEWIKARKQKKSSKQTTGQVSSMVATGATLVDINIQYPSFVMMNKKRLEDYIAWTKTVTLRSGLLSWKLLVMQTGSTTVENTIATWLNANLFKTRPFSTKQLFVHGPTSMGKTTFIEKLAGFCAIYCIPRDEDFYDFYEDFAYDLAVLDEFKGNKTIQWFNAWLDGSTQVLKKKGSQVVKTFNIPTIVLSNYPLRECYPNVDDIRFETISRRFLQIEVTSPINVL